MSRLPAGVAPADDVLVADVAPGVVYRLPDGDQPACNNPDTRHRVSAGHASHGLCGSPCSGCWPDPHGLGRHVTAVGGAARTRAWSV